MPGELFLFRCTLLLDNYRNNYEVLSEWKYVIKKNNLGIRRSNILRFLGFVYYSTIKNNNLRTNKSRDVIQYTGGICANVSVAGNSVEYTRRIDSKRMWSIRADA